jgi:hypothetical protein
MANDTQYEIFQHYGTNAERLAFVPAPAAGIQPIYIWYETDTGDTFLYWTSWIALATASGPGISELTGDVLAGPGSGAQAAAIHQDYKIRSIGTSLAGGGSPITTGIKGTGTYIPYDCTIILAVIGADQPGNLVVDIWVSPFPASYPPVDANSITGGNEPDTAGNDNYSDAVLNLWSVGITAGSWIFWNVDSNDVIEDATIQLIAVVTI